MHTYVHSCFSTNTCVLVAVLPMTVWSCTSGRELIRSDSRLFNPRCSWCTSGNSSAAGSLTYIHTHIRTYMQYVHAHLKHVHAYVVYIRMYVCMYVCMYVSTQLEEWEFRTFTGMVCAHYIWHMYIVSSRCVMLLCSAFYRIGAVRRSPRWPQWRRPTSTNADVDCYWTNIFG